MPALTFHGSIEPPTDAAIEAFEQRVKLTLPPEYRSFLKAHNGGKVSPNYVLVQGPVRLELMPVKEFLALGRRDPVLSLETQVRNFKYPGKERLPDDLMPIAIGGYGDYYCLAFKGPRLGQVFCWDHARNESEHKRYDNIYPLASSLDAFFDMLREEPPPNAGVGHMRKYGPDLTEGELAAFESEYGINLPPKYRKFLLSFNGGDILPDGVPLAGGCGSTLRYFYSLNATQWYPYRDIRRECDDMKNPSWPRMPPEYLPIAADDFGNYYVVATDGPKTDQIFFWEHEEEGIDSYTYDNLYFVAQDIDALLQNLTD